MDLIEALRTIKKECIKNDDCINCPLRTVHGECEITRIEPERWGIPDKPEIIPRIFE